MKAILNKNMRSLIAGICSQSLNRVFKTNNYLKYFIHQPFHKSLLSIHIEDPFLGIAHIALNMLVAMSFTFYVSMLNKNLETK